MNKKDMLGLLEKAPKHLTENACFFSPGLKPPGKLNIGLGALAQLGREAQNLTTGRKALLVSDEVLNDLGTVDLAALFLREAGYSVEVFTDVEPEPHLETADSLYTFAMGCDEEVSVVIGLGGGSVMDISKMIAQCLGNSLPPCAYADSDEASLGSGVPLILLPTTSGTGSEVSIYSVICRGDEKQLFAGQKYLPDIAIIDPLLTVSMPASVTAATGMDALTHAIEAIMHTKCTPMCEGLGLAAIDMIVGNLRRAFVDGEDLEARYNMAVGSAMAMMSFNMSGGLYAHSVSYILGMHKQTPHGLGCALGLPYLMEFNLPVAKDKLAKIARFMGEPTHQITEESAALKAVEAVSKLMLDVGMPLTLKQYGIDESTLETLAAQTIELFPRPGNPRAMGSKESIQFWRAMYEGAW